MLSFFPASACPPTKCGNLIGIDRATASRLLRGERKPNTAHIRKTAEALGLEVSLLI
jgi:transcriptional regulator with XRE-family HTH domain